MERRDQQNLGLVTDTRSARSSRNSGHKNVDSLTEAFKAMDGSKALRLIGWWARS